MSSDIPLPQRMRIGFSFIFWFVLTILFVLALAVVLVWPVWILALLALIALVGALITIGVRRLLSKEASAGITSAAFAKTALAFFMLLVTATALPVYYSAYSVDAHPGVMPLVHLTDGKRTVIFQGMQHVASEDFYKSVVYDAEKALAEGYTLYKEGVQPSPENPELGKWFNMLATGGKDLSGSYKALADTCGLKFQLDYFGVIEADAATNPSRHFIADVTYKDMKDEYDRLAADPQFVEKFKRETSVDGTSLGGPMDFALRILGNPNAGQKNQLGMVCRAILGVSTKSKPTANSAKERIILDYRNRRLAEMLDTAPQTKIYVTYGAAHLPGVIADLKARNAAWKVVSTSWRRVLANPETFKGEL